MKLLLTFELGRLARWLRILGIDAAYSREDRPASCILQALREDRTIITRNHRLAKPHGIGIIALSSENLREQLCEALKALHMGRNEDIMFSRCIRCNTGLKPIAKQEVKDKIPAYVFQTQDRFMSCPQCLRIYWQGTHWGNVQKTLEEIGL